MGQPKKLHKVLQWALEFKKTTGVESNDQSYFLRYSLKYPDKVGLDYSQRIFMTVGQSNIDVTSKGVWNQGYKPPIHCCFIHFPGYPKVGGGLTNILKKMHEFPDYYILTSRKKIRVCKID